MKRAPKIAERKTGERAKVDPPTTSNRDAPPSTDTDVRRSRSSNAETGWRFVVKSTCETWKKHLVTALKPRRRKR
jgi:hypothetical protein